MILELADHDAIILLSHLRKSKILDVYDCNFIHMKTIDGHVFKLYTIFFKWLWSFFILLVQLRQIIIFTVSLICTTDRSYFLPTFLNHFNQADCENRI